MSKESKNSNTKHLSDFTFNSASFFIGLFPSLIAIPFYLKYLGTTQLGIYYLYLAFVGIGGTFDLGITQTVVKYYSQYKEKSQRFLSYLLSSSSLIINLSNTLVCILGGIWLVVGIVFFNYSTLDTYRVMLFVAGIVLQMRFNFYLSILRGDERYRKMALVEAINKLVFTLSGILVAYLFQIVEYVLACHVVSLCIQNLAFKKGKYFSNKGRSFSLNLSFFKSNLWEYSKWILVQNTLGFLNGNIDKFLVASFVNIDGLTVYNTAQNIARLVPAFFSKGLGYLLPFVSKIGDKEIVRRFYLKSSYKFNIVLGVIYLAAVFVLPYLIPLYLKSDLEVAEKVNQIIRFLLISAMFTTTAILSFNLFNALGEVKTNTIIPLYGNIFSIVVVFLGGYFFGFWGIVFAKMNNVVSSIVIRSMTYNKVFSKNDVWIGLKMAFPLIMAIFFYELYLLFKP